MVAVASRWYVISGKGNPLECTRPLYIAALRKLHVRFHAVNPTPEVFDVSIEGRLRPIHRIRRAGHDIKGDPHGGWTDDEGSDVEACAEFKARKAAREAARNTQNRDDVGYKDATEDKDCISRMLPRGEKAESPDKTIVSLLTFAIDLATSDWCVAYPGDENECFIWLSRWLIESPGMEAWLMSLAPITNSSSSQRPDADTLARVMRLMLFGIVLHYQRDAPWCVEWSSFHYASMVPVYSCPSLARLVSRLPCFRVEGKFVSFMVEALVFPFGELGWFTSVSVSLLDRSNQLDSRVDTFVERLPACIQTYWPEFARHKAYRMWIQDQVRTSVECDAFQEWLSGDHAEHFPLVVQPAEWARWQVWLQLAMLVDPTAGFLVCLGCDDTHRPDLTQPLIVHADGSSEALSQAVCVEGDLIGYPFASTPDDRAAAFAVRIEQSSSAALVRFRRYAWSATDSTKLEVHEISMSVVARIVPHAYEKLDTWLEWTEHNDARHVRRRHITYTRLGRLDEIPAGSGPARTDDPREVKQTPVVDWARCATLQVHTSHTDKYKAWLPASCKGALYLECIDSPEAFATWFALQRDAETSYSD
jgi:hypothetical protein